MGLKDRLIKLASPTNTEHLEVEDNKSNEDEKPSLSNLSKNSSIGNEIFRLDNHRVDFKALNLFIKLAGALLIVILFIVLINLISDTLVKPIFNILNIISPFILGLVFAWLLNPIVTRTSNAEFVKKTKTSRGVVSAILTLLIGLVAFLAVILLAYITINEIVVFLSGGTSLIELFSGSQDPLTVFVEYANGTIEGATPQTNAYKGLLYLCRFAGLVTYENGLYGLSSELAGVDLANILGVIGSFASQFFIAIIVAMYTLPTFSKVGSSFKKLIPKKFKKTGSEIIDIMGRSFSSYMRGALLIAFILGSIITAGLTVIAFLSSFVFEVESGLFVINSASSSVAVLLTIITFGVICMLTNLVPYVGPIIGGFIVASLTLLTDTSPGYWVTFSTIGLIFIVQSLESMFLQPLIMGKHTSLHPVIILMGIAIFSAVFGLIGMLVATPIVAVFRSVFVHLNKKYDLF